MAETVAYWKQKAEEAQARCDELQNEMSEFEESSRTLEAEQEKEIERLEAKLKEAKSKHEVSQRDSEFNKERLQEQLKQQNAATTKLQDQLKTANATIASLQLRVQALEQENDDFSRQFREASESLSSFENLIESRLEENTFLQTELDDAQEKIRTMAEEIKDLKLECELLRSKSEPYRDDSHSSDSATPVSSQNGHTVKNSMIPVTPARTSKTSIILTPPTSSRPSDTQEAATPYRFKATPGQTPSRNNNALTLVHELLGRLSGLENRLSTCRDAMRSPTPQRPKSPSANLNVNGKTPLSRHGSTTK